jgi:hypothetical protein
MFEICCCWYRTAQKIPVTIAVFLDTCKNLLHVHAGGSVAEDYAFPEGGRGSEGFANPRKTRISELCERRDGVKSLNLRRDSFHILQVCPQHLRHAPRLRNASARTMWRIPFEDLGDVTETSL